jgi:hypothetical protein
MYDRITAILNTKMSEEHPVDLVVRLMQLNSKIPLVPPVVTPEMQAAMEYNRRLNIARYGDPWEYMFDEECECKEDD